MLYARLLGTNLPAPLAQLYCEGTSASAAGSFLVRRRGRAGARVPVTLTITRTPEGEIWDRTFGGRRIVSRQHACDGLLCEAFGPVEFRFRLVAEGQGIRFRQTGVSLWGVRLPRLLAPQVEAMTWCEAGQQGVHVQVRVTAPVVGPLVSYEGLLNENRAMASGAAGRDRSL